MLHIFIHFFLMFQVIFLQVYFYISFLYSRGLSFAFLSLLESSSVFHGLLLTFLWLNIQCIVKIVARFFINSWRIRLSFSSIPFFINNNVAFFAIQGIIHDIFIGFSIVGGNFYIFTIQLLRLFPWYSLDARPHKSIFIELIKILFRLLSDNINISFLRWLLLPFLDRFLHIFKCHFIEQIIISWW